MATLFTIIIIVLFIVDFIIAMLLLAIPFFIIAFAYIRHSIPLEKELYRELHAAKMCTYTDDARKSVSGIEFFLWKCEDKLSEKTDELRRWKIPSTYSSDTVFFVRMCHVLGCEIVIRKVADHDIEEEPNNPELIKLRDK